MFNGGAVINRRTRSIIRFAGLVIPVILCGYGLLVDAGLVDSTHYAGTTFFTLLIIPWVALAVVQFLRPNKGRASVAGWLAFYHLIAALYILFVAGFGMPFTASWILLLIGSYVYFSSYGMWMSVVILALTASIDILLHGRNETIVIVDVVTTIAILVIGFAAVAIGHVQEVDEAELSKTKALESLQRDRILTIVNNLADAILSTDEKGIITVYNAASLNLLDTNAGLDGQSIDDVLKVIGQDKQPVHVFSEMKKAKAVVMRDDLTTTIGDETIRLELTYSPIRGSYRRSKSSEKKGDGYILILRDVTKAKSLEEERDEFISVVSHELRTPIAITEGTLSNTQLMMDREDVPKETLKQSVNMAHDQVIFLAKMVNDLSTLSRAERGVADTPEIIDVRMLVNELYKEYAPQAEAKKLHFNLDASTHLGSVNASRLYLQELLQNFITNSIKYTREGSITLHVNRKKDAITFEVADTGIGISNSDQKKIFQKFYRSEDYRTRETGGTGLGLYVAMKLSKKLGTKITVQSRLNHGSTFGFTLPTKD